MRVGPHTSSKSLFDLPSDRIDYKQLREISPEAARRAVLEYLRTNKGNICQTARLFGINRTVVYDIKSRSSSLTTTPYTQLSVFFSRRIDVNSRFKLISYSWEKSWTNDLSPEGWVISWLRSHGVKTRILFTVDNGEEFGGKSWMKVRELRRLIGGFGCRLTQNHK